MRLGRYCGSGRRPPRMGWGLQQNAPLAFAAPFCTVIPSLSSFPHFERAPRPPIRNPASSEEPRASARGFFYRKSHSTWGLSALKPPWPFIPALPSGAFWLFHVTPLTGNSQLPRRRGWVRGTIRHRVCCQQPCVNIPGKDKPDWPLPRQKDKRSPKRPCRPWPSDIVRLILIPEHSGQDHRETTKT
jgi:hypothetical protein